MSEQYKNFGRTTLSTAIDADDTTLTVADGSVFPSSGDFRIRIDNELMLCTSRTSNQLVVQRAVEQTTATNHTSASAVTGPLTAAALTAIIQDLSDTVTGFTASRAITSNGSGSLTASSVTSTELGYLSGVTSGLQTQLAAKQPL